ncbi:NAD-dependent epimerase/dehydratase family protein [Streptosporangiaceae bacterium NEAU-GS5]|nr:NAD-dependent epimerase/dehydratase family protein [Streptosporangiaceae bacterium NEAU-GS5]
MGRYLILGAGQVGRGVARILSGEGHEAVIVTRSGSMDGVAADASDADAMRKLAAGADAIINCVNPRYHRWPQDWPPIHHALMAAAESSGAVLVTLSNLYGYGPLDVPMTEDTPLNSKGTKGRVRAQMWHEALAAHKAGRIRATEVRASDYYGLGASDQSYIGPRFLTPLMSGKPAVFLTDPSIPHSWTYLPDTARMLVTAAMDERAWGRPWHVPTAPPLPAREMAERFCRLAGAPAPRIRVLPRFLLTAAGTVVPVVRELRETRYQFDRPFELDSSYTEATFDLSPTPIDEALEATLAELRKAVR